MDFETKILLMAKPRGHAGTTYERKRISELMPVPRTAVLFLMHLGSEAGSRVLSRIQA